MSDIQRIEQVNRRWRWGLSIGFALLSLAVVAQYGRGPTLRARKLVVARENSEVIITDGQIVVRDRDGDLRLGIGLANGKAEAMVLDGQGMPPIQLVVEEDGDGMITYRDANGARRVSTRTMASGTAKTAYFRSAEQARAYSRRVQGWDGSNEALRPRRIASDRDRS